MTVQEFCDLTKNKPIRSVENPLATRWSREIAKAEFEKEQSIR